MTVQVEFIFLSDNIYICIKDKTTCAKYVTQTYPFKTNSASRFFLFIHTIVTVAYNPISFLDIFTLCLIAFPSLSTEEL